VVIHDDIVLGGVVFFVGFWYFSGSKYTTPYEWSNKVKSHTKPV